MRRQALPRAALVAAGGAVSLLFLYPYWWMMLGALRTTREVLGHPLRLWPEQFDWAGFRSIAAIGGTPLWLAAINSCVITAAATALAIGSAALGAYAISRRPQWRLFRALRYGFLLTMMYPAMLMVIPIYVVMFHLGLLGSYAGIIFFLAVGPVPFFLFDQFFRALPASVLEQAMVDGAGELAILARIVLPMARPVVATVAIITFLLTWAEWLPVMVISTSPATYTLPVALLDLNGELDTNPQGIMALSIVITLPVAVLFLITQRRVLQGFAEGAVKG